MQFHSNSEIEDTTNYIAMFSNISDGCNIFSRFADSYSQIHGYLSVIVCSIGVPLNILNIIVLTRRNMISRPTNLILTFLASSDLITMFSNLFYTIWFNLMFPIMGGCNANFSYLVERDTHFWTVYKTIHVNLSVTTHSFSVWLTVYLAVFRYIVIRKHGKFKKFKAKMCFKNFLSYKACFKMIITIGIFCLIFCSPAYFLYYADVELFENNTNGTVIYVYTLKETNLNKASNGNLFKFTFYLQSVLAKLLPCVILVTFTILLINSLVRINRNKRRLKRLHFKDEMNQKNGIKIKFKVKSEAFRCVSSLVKINLYGKSKEHLRTTLMLIIICLLFLIAELPQSILLFVSIIFQEHQVYERVYMPLGDLMDIIVLFNSSINFILYCTMSCAFRSTFYYLLTNTIRIFKSCHF